MEFMALFTGISALSVILFIIGIGLIIGEMFDPNFGFNGFLGVLGVIILIVNVFITAQTIRQGVILTVILFIIVVAILFVFLSLASKGRIPKKLILQEATSAEEGFSGTDDMQYLIGKTGTVATICRPVGNVDFDGVKLDVVSRGEYIEKGAKVEVIEVEGNKIVIRAVPGN